MCLICDADFGRLRLRGQDTVSTVLVELFAGSTYQHYSASYIYSGVLTVSARVFFSAQGNIPRVVDQVFDEHIQRQREWLRGDPKRLTKMRGTSG